MILPLEVLRFMVAVGDEYTQLRLKPCTHESHLSQWCFFTVSRRCQQHQRQYFGPSSDHTAVVSYTFEWHNPEWIRTCALQQTEQSSHLPEKLGHFTVPLYCTCTHAHTHIYIYVYTCIYIYYRWRDREMDRWIDDLMRGSTDYAWIGGWMGR